MKNVYIQLQLFIKQLEEKHIIFYSAATFTSQPISLINQTETNSPENRQEPKVNIQCRHYPLCHPLLIKADTFSNKPWIIILVQTLLNCTKEESRGVAGRASQHVAQLQQAINNSTNSFLSVFISLAFPLQYSLSNIQYFLIYASLLNISRSFLFLCRFLLKYLICLISTLY